MDRDETCLDVLLAACWTEMRPAWTCCLLDRDETCLDVLLAACCCRRENARSKKKLDDSLQKVMYFWMNGRLRMAFDTLRCGANSVHICAQAAKLDRCKACANVHRLRGHCCHDHDPAELEATRHAHRLRLVTNSDASSIPFAMTSTMRPQISYPQSALVPLNMCSHRAMGRSPHQLTCHLGAVLCVTEPVLCSYAPCCPRLPCPAFHITPP